VTASFDPSSRNRLTSYDLGRFASTSLFDRIGRVVCATGKLPRKELYEAWEVARRTRRLFRGGHVVDFGGGHGLLAHLMLILDDSSPTAVVVDPTIPASAGVLHDALCGEWPRLAGRVRFETGSVVPDPSESSVVVSCHACGALTDRAIDLAVDARARLAVLPCCHDDETCDAGALRGWMDLSLAIDATRVARLRAAGARVWTQQIPETITPKNRLLLADCSDDLSVA
jgi:hypothetical protein